MRKLLICLCSSGVRESLQYCVESLRQQALPDGVDVSVLVVDNSRDALLRDFIKQQPEAGLPLIYAHEPHSGIPFARNCALREAQALAADWIAFIDDDEIAPRHWLVQLLACLNANQADVVVGEVGRCETLQMAVLSANDCQPQGPTEALPRVKTAVTSNVLLGSRLFSDSGMGLRFDEGMVFGGSDREFFMRAVQQGAQIVYAANELVYEAWPAERRKPIYLLMRWFRYGVSFNYRYRKNMAPAKGCTLILLMFLYKLLGAPIKLLLLPLRKIRDKRPLRRLVGTSLADVAYAFGCIAPFFGVTLSRYY